ncbi:hypothetical protein M5689_011521 [Euphorbia peplus]|nr:hypothetical protein M5689_011521 [Euphorbia peplus]
MKRIDIRFLDLIFFYWFTKGLLQSPKSYNSFWSIAFKGDLKQFVADFLLSFPFTFTQRIWTYRSTSNILCGFRIFSQVAISSQLQSVVPLVNNTNIAENSCWRF